MKAWVLHGINDIRLEGVNRPVPDKGQALVKVMAAGICGSDIPRIFTTGAHKYPLIPGHEFAGEVEVVGSADDENLIGKRVGVFPLIPCGDCVGCNMGHPELCRNYNYLGSRCDGGFAEYVCVPVDNLIEIPDNVPYECAAMLEPMAVAVHAIRRAGLIKSFTGVTGESVGESGVSGKENLQNNSDNDLAGKTAVVIGAGTIGLLISAFLKDAGVGEVLVVGNKEIQKQAAISLGINEKNWISAKDACGADYVFECVGSERALEEAILAAGPMGTVVTVGNPHGDMTLPRDIYWKILRNQLHLVGTWNSYFSYGQNDDWSYVLDRLKAGAVKPECLITHRFELDSLDRGFSIMRDKAEPYIKIMFSE